MKIIFHGRNALTFEPGFAAMLDDGHSISVVPDVPTTPEDIAAFQTADVIIGIALNASHPQPNSLRLYHAPAAGVDAIDRARLPKGCALCCCYGHESAIAEYVMTALLLRHVPIPAADRDLRQGRWTYWAGNPTATRTELGDCTIGLLGFGHIGRTIAARAKAFGMRVTVANRTEVQPGQTVDQFFRLDQMREFMASADYIVASLPFMPTTKSLVDANALAAMRPDAVILNVGRGPVIDEQALYDALASQRIAGAVIDTWYVYPSATDTNPNPGTLPFHQLKNCVLTPHMSGWTNGTIRRRQQTMAENIRRLAKGEQLINLL